MESQFIAWLRSQLPGHPALAVGPGDDAAVVELQGAQQIVVTTDLLTDGVDFRLKQDDPRRIGRKAMAVNLSDLAAMAARPLAAVISVALPRQSAGAQSPSASLVLPQQLYEGILPLSQRYGVALAGGDTNTWDGPLVISITLFGTPGPRGPLLRSGARPGDKILVTGTCGGSILGKHFDFEPRVWEALALAERYPLHAGIDVSDGLSLDLFRLANESGCGALLDLDQIPIDPAAYQLSEKQADGVSPLEHALSDGEDFELILAVDASVADAILQEWRSYVPLTCIGQFVEEPGLWERLPDGQRRPLTPRGYEHR